MFVLGKTSVLFNICTATHKNSVRHLVNGGDAQCATSFHPSHPFRTAVTFDDVMLVPKYSSIQSRKEISLKTKLTRKITIMNPLVSSNMDTVTEDKMAIAMARNGGVGIIHRYLPIEEQVSMVLAVKRSESLKVESPHTCSKLITVQELHSIMTNHNIHSMLVTDEENRLEGIVTRRDMRFADRDTKVVDIMTPREKLVVASARSTLEEAKRLLSKHKLECLPLVNGTNHLCGLITSKDIINHLLRPHASLDAKGSLLVGAAVGVSEGYLERVERLMEAGVDFVLVDIAHGHSYLALNATETIKKTFPNIEVITGNVCTTDATRDAINAGADAVKVGVGPGSVSKTRIVTGCGVPQVTAILDCSREAMKHGVPIIADGGIRTSGDIVKALACGASAVMLGSRLAGCDESPGQAILKDGKKVKIIRGMAGYKANISERQRRKYMDDVYDVIPEGVDGTVPYQGPLQEVVSQLVGGIVSGIGYCGATNIDQLQAISEMVMVTDAGKKESSYHDVDILSE